MLLDQAREVERMVVDMRLHVVLGGDLVEELEVTLVGLHPAGAEQEIADRVQDVERDHVRVDQREQAVLE